MKRTKEEICEAVISAVSQAYGIDCGELMHSRERRSTDARHMAYYVLHCDYYVKHRELAEIFRKGLTDFCHGIRKTGRDIGRYEDVAALHRLIINKLEAL